MSKLTRAQFTREVMKDIGAFADFWIAGQADPEAPEQAFPEEMEHEDWVEQFLVFVTTPREPE